jgi:ComF family protein
MDHLLSLLRSLFPAVCIICGRTVLHDAAHHSAICGRCDRSLPHNTSCCQRCALPLPGIGLAPAKRLCGQCIRQLPEFDYLLSVFRYEGEIVRKVRQFKFAQRINYARTLGQCMLRYVEQNRQPAAGIDAIVPVPLHTKRIWRRGFNQSAELAREIAGGLSVAIRHDLVERHQHTASQTSLDLKQRKRNLRGAFRVIGDVRGLHILVVDDVVTTGSTVNELAKVLKKAGADSVGVISLARVAQPAKRIQ